MSGLIFLNFFTPEEVVRVLAGVEGGIDYPHIDRLLTQVRSPRLGVLEVMKLVDDMVGAEVIAFSASHGRYIKGVNWTPVDASRAKKAILPDNFSES